MNFSEITFKCVNHIATITLNRPDSLNALSLSMTTEIARAIKQVQDDSDCSVLVFTGAGRAFCAGGDIKAMQKSMSVTEGRNYVREVGQTILAMRNLEKPIIAAVNGYAMGAGFNLALAADLIIAAEESKFGQVFSRIGLAIDAGGSFFLPRAIGAAWAKELVFTGRMISAKEAYQLGLINKVTAKENLEQETYDLATSLARGPAQALGLAKMLINKGLTADLESALDNEAFAQSICMQTEDHKEGVAAFLGKRTPQFKGK